jgi:hypothetical protein
MTSEHSLEPLRANSLSRPPSEDPAHVAQCRDEVLSQLSRLTHEQFRFSLDDERALAEGRYEQRKRYVVPRLLMIDEQLSTEIIRMPGHVV